MLWPVHRAYLYFFIGDCLAGTAMRKVGPTLPKARPGFHGRDKF